jgi:HEAT repeat protein
MMILKIINVATLAAMISMMTLGQEVGVLLLPPDLTKNNTIDRGATYNLGATGLRGWIYTKAANDLDSQQGRTTTASRQVLVTHVGKNSPAEGIIRVDDVILGVAGKPFIDDARKSIAFAIQEAEVEESKGILKLTIWRKGKIYDFSIKLKVMGRYAATAPFNCNKSKLIFDNACKILEKEPLEPDWSGAVNALALLATGDVKYLPKLRDFAHELGPETLQLELKDGSVVWDWAYNNIFLCEYFLKTGDHEVMHAIEQYTIFLSKGQSMYGTFGHGISGLTTEGKLHGSIPPYGPVNAAGLVANIAIVMGKKCGVKDAEIDDAIDRGSKFFSYFVDKGAIPYGEHMPWANHDNNGKNAMAAVFFALQGDKVKETKFFAKMVTASYQNREYGHTGQGFSYLWGALGANTGGPSAATAFIKESLWHLDLVRRCDGSFTYDGDEQYGAGKTDDDTYYGNSGYEGLNPTASYVLTYSLPLKSIYLTGRNDNKSNWLDEKDVSEAIYSGHFDLTRATLTNHQLIEAFQDWSPIVRSWAAEELGKRHESTQFVPELIAMAEGSDAHQRQGAAEALGVIRDPSALGVLARLLTHEDRWLRVKAANALKNMKDKAKPIIPEMLKAVVDTAKPVYPVVWEDPIQLTHGELASALFEGLLRKSIKNVDPKLLYPAIQAIARNPDGKARTTLSNIIENQLSAEDVEKLAPDLVEAVKIPCPADTMFSAEIRMSAFLSLSKNHYKEAINLGIIFAKTQGGHGSETRTGEIVNIIASYGTAANSAIPGLNELIEIFNEQTKNKEFPADLNLLRIRDVKKAIKSIKQSTTQPLLKTIGAEPR